jgi:hypothetical protein
MTSADFAASPLGNDSITDFKDMKINYKVDVRKATDLKPGAFYNLHLNVPTGLSKLSADEQAIINAINAASEGFTVPSYTNGFGLRAMYGLSFKQGAKGKLDVSLGYNYTGAFDSSETNEVDTSDNIMFQLKGSREINPNRSTRYGLNYMYFFDGEFTDKTLGDTTTTERDGDFLLFFGMSNKINPGLNNTIYFSYTYRGLQDYVDAGGTSSQLIDLGDITTLSLMQHSKMRNNTWLDYGLNWRYTSNADFKTGVQQDTKRNDLGIVVGATKEINDGFKMKGALQVGLTDDSRDLVVSFGGGWDF